MITFTHDDKLVFLGPSAIMEDDLFSENTPLREKMDDKNNKSILLIIDGITHSLYETTTTTSKHLDEGESRIEQSKN